MALKHKHEDIPSDPPSKVEGYTRAQLAILFANLWGLLVGFPLLVTHERPLPRGLLAVLPAGLFAAGLALSSGRKRGGDPLTGRPMGAGPRLRFRRQAGAGCLIVGVPVAMSLALAEQQAAGIPALSGLGTAGLLIATGSLWAYGASALAFCLPAPVPAPARTSPLTGAPPGGRTSRWSLRTRLVAALFALGGFCTGVLAPAASGPPDLSADPGATRAWALLASVVGSGLAVAITALFLGNALTPARGRATRRIPAAWLLSIAALGLVTYYVISN